MIDDSSPRDRVVEMTERLLREAGISAGMRVLDWETVEREGATTAMGLELSGALESAGLELTGIRAEAIVHTATRRHTTASIVRAMLPRMVAQGVASEASVDIDTLDARLAEELRRTHSAHVSDLVFSAWARKPS